MTDSPRPDGTEPTQPLGRRYPSYPDPAYAANAQYRPPAGTAHPTEPIAHYPAYAVDQYPPAHPAPDPDPPEPPRSPRWLWVVAVLAVFIVVCLGFAVIIATSSTREHTIVAPLPTTTEPALTSPSTPTTTAPILPLPTIALPTFPAPTVTAPTDSPSPTGATEPVVYQVTGEGRAISITYIDSAHMMQTEFNVALPWSRQVALPKPAQASASVTIINVGPAITCTVTIDGVEVQHRTGAGLTICSGTS